MDVSVALVGTLDGGGIFYVHIGSIAAAVVLFPMSCLGLVCVCVCSGHRFQGVGLSHAIPIARSSPR